MLTSYADDEALFAAIMAGAAGYVLKQVGSTRTWSTTSGRVAAGQSLLDPGAHRAGPAQRLREKPDEDPLLASLTPQERRILDLIAEGQTNRQIAGELFLAEKTVKNYVSNLLSKLGMERRTQAATYATKVAERAAQGPEGRHGHVALRPWLTGGEPPVRYQVRLVGRDRRSRPPTLAFRALWPYA